MTPDVKGFPYPEVDREICLQCGNCEAVCPVVNQEGFKAPEESVFYGCKNSDDSIRLASSSGGFFYELAKGVIDKGGVVFGARFSEDYKKVYHTAAITIDEVRPMMVSKYVQSEIGLSYIAVRNYLKEGRVVLFTGTPCQVAGLRSFLGEDYDNLILAEIVCHGVPSPKVWDLYLSSLEKEYGGKASFVTFRDKSRSWRHSDFRVEFDNGNSFIQPNKDNPYMKSFLRNLNIRESCTDCEFKRFASGADITMGDFWGSTEIGLTYNDDVGISVIALHSDKGFSWFKAVNHRMYDIVQLSEKSAYVFNESVFISASKHDGSELFYNRIEREPFDGVVEDMLKDDLRISNNRTNSSVSLLHRLLRLIK